MKPLAEIVALADRREATHLLVEYYLAHPSEQDAIRRDWNYDAEWDFPPVRKLALSREDLVVSRNVQTALGYSSIVDFEPDWRDHVVLLGVCWHALGASGVPAEPMFQKLSLASSSTGASRFADFLARPQSERELRKFGWEAFETADGLEYRPAGSA